MGTPTEPVYLRVLEDLRTRIRSGSLEPGARIPSRNAIITNYGVGETAAKHALAVLLAEGLIEARPGSGCYVRKVPAAGFLEHDRPQFPGSPFGVQESDAGVRCGGAPVSQAAGLGASDRAGACARAGRQEAAARGGRAGDDDQVPAARRRRAGAARHELRGRRADRRDAGRASRAGAAGRARRDRADALDRNRDRRGDRGSIGAAVGPGRGRRAGDARRADWCSSSTGCTMPAGRRSSAPRSWCRPTGSGSGTGSHGRAHEPPAARSRSGRLSPLTCRGSAS